PSGRVRPHRRRRQAPPEGPIRGAEQPMTLGQKRCNFCGRGSAEVKLMVSAPSGEVHICSDCAARVHDIVVDSTPTFRPVLKPQVPREIKRVLDDYIIEQEEAKRSLAVAVYN